MTVGIERINIVSDGNGRGAYRFEMSRVRQPAADRLYRRIFTRLGMTLLPGEAVQHVTPQGRQAQLDSVLGIDVILRFVNGMEVTLQEKFLTYTKTTVTVEYQQDPQRGLLGDWQHLKADYYFVGYDRLEAHDFQEWILLDWPMVKQATTQGHIPWCNGINKHDGARASFRYIDFSHIPQRCIVHGFWRGVEYRQETPNHRASPPQGSEALVATQEEALLALPPPASELPVQPAIMAHDGREEAPPSSKPAGHVRATRSRRADSTQLVFDFYVQKEPPHA